MSITLQQLLDQVEAQPLPVSLALVLRALAHEWIQHTHAVSTFTADSARQQQRLLDLEAEVARIDKRFDTQAVFARDRFSELSRQVMNLQAQVSANDAQHTRLTADVRRLEDFAGFGTVMGRTLPHPLPRWNQCLLERMVNAVVVREGAMSPPRESYVFDDFETAGRFVAAVLTQKLPVFDQAVGYAAEQRRRAAPPPLKEDPS